MVNFEAKAFSRTSIIKASLLPTSAPLLISMQLTGVSFQSSEFGRKNMPASGLVVANSDTSDNGVGVHDPSVYAYQLVYPDKVIRRFLHGIHPRIGKGFSIRKLGISCGHLLENSVVMRNAHSDLKMRPASSHTSLPAPYNGRIGSNKPLVFYVHR